jgi:hypothetical protein
VNELETKAVLYAARLADLERRGSVEYRGVWRDQEYPQASLTTHSGSLWIAQERTTARPGHGKGWKLIVKSGRA